MSGSPPEQVRNRR